MITAIDGQSGAGMLYSHLGVQACTADCALRDLDGLFFRGFMLGRPVVGDKQHAQRYSHKTAIKQAEKMARMYGCHFSVVEA